MKFQNKKTLFEQGKLKALLYGAALLTLLLTTGAQAQTWSTTPGSGVWNTAANWSTLSEPNSQAAAATFGASTTTSLTFNAGITVGSLLFNNGSPVYNFAVSNPLALFGTGITDNGAAPETFTVSNTLNFFNSATSANSVINVSSGGTAGFNMSSTASTSKINIATGGALVFASSGSSGFSTAASATITNNGALSFTNSSTAGSATILNNGAVSFLNSSTAGSAAVSNTGNIGFFSDSSSVFSNAGNANINNTAAASLSFTGYSSAASATIFNNGTMAFIGNSTAGSATIFDANLLNFYGSATGGNALININGADAVSFNNSSSAGAASIVNNGSITFNGDSSSVFSTAGSAVIQNYGSLTFNNFTSAGSAKISNNLGSGQINFWNNSTASNAVINSTGGSVVFNDSTTAGNASITVTGTGVGFVGTASAGAATITAISANGSQGGINFAFTGAGGTARLILGANSLLSVNEETLGTAVTVGSIEGVSSASATLGQTNLFVGSNNLNTTFAGSMGTGPTPTPTASATPYVPGAVTKIGTGTWTLTGNNTYLGGTTITGGAINISSDGANGIYNLGDISSTLTFNGGTLQAGGALSTARSISIDSNNGTVDTNGNAMTLTGAIRGTGSLAVTSSLSGGSLDLNGPNNYSGGTTVNAGTLMSGAAGALGTGLITVNGGTLTTDGSNHSLNSGGNYVQGTKGTLQLGLAGASAGQWDKLTVTGTAGLNGTLQLVSYNGFKPTAGQSFQMITSTGALSGQFGTLNDLLSAPVSLSYGANSVTMTVLSFGQFGGTSNEKTLSKALDSMTAASTNPALLNAVASLPSTGLNAAYDQMSPSNLSPMFAMGFATAQVQAGQVGQHLSGLFNDSHFNSQTAWLVQPMFASTMSADEEEQIAQTVPQPERWGGFVNAMNNFGTITSDGNSAGYQFNTGGITGGADYRLDKDWVGGLMMGYDQSSTSQSTGTVNVSGGQLGLYSGVKMDALHVSALLDGGLDNYTTQRTGFGGNANGSTSGTEWTGQLNLGYDLRSDDLLVTPFAAGQLTQVNVSGFTETGSLAPLTFASQSQTYISSDLGAQFSLGWNIGGMKLSPSVSAAWEHIYQGSSSSLTANFGSGNNFTVAGSATGTDGAVLGGGLNAQFDKGFSVYAAYQGKVGITNYTDQNISGGINLGF